MEVQTSEQNVEVEIEMEMKNDITDDVTAGGPNTKPEPSQEGGAGKSKAEVEEPKSQSGPQSNEPESAKEEGDLIVNLLV